MKCGDIHDSKCEEALPDTPSNGDEVWRFCPRCGRPTGHLIKPLSGGRLIRPHGLAGEGSIPLRIRGYSSVTVTLDLMDSAEGVILSTRKLIVSPTAGGSVVILIPEISPGEHELGTVMFHAYDTSPPVEDPFGERPARTLPLQLTGFYPMPAMLAFQEEIALFHEKCEERCVHLMNQGETEAENVRLIIPRGFKLLNQSQNLGRIEPGQWVAISLKHDYALRTAGDYPLKALADDNVLSVMTLHILTPAPARILDEGIVGIDFGTSHSSISWRLCRNLPNTPDNIVFLTPEGETQSERFPTLVWLSLKGEMQFGSEARTCYNSDPTRGILFHEIKTLLRDPDNIHADHFRSGNLIVKGIEPLASKILGLSWRELLITSYLQWLFRSAIQPAIMKYIQNRGAAVRYVFSLPVLDHSHEKHVLYESQESGMKRCIQNAGFPMDRVEFAFEPVCATLGLLSPRPKWPRLGTSDYPVKNEDQILVFDSGGGTTDVALSEMQTEEGNAGRIRLRVLNCLGVGHNLDTFGGEWVTERLHQVLEDPAEISKKKYGKWFEGTLDFPELTTYLESDGEERRELRSEDIERKVKFVIGKGEAYKGLQGTILPSLLDILLEEKLASLKEEIERIIASPGALAKVRYYLFVGGNMRMHPMRRQGVLIMRDPNPNSSGRLLLLPDSDLQLAVGYGAAWEPDARVLNSAPYSFQIRLECEGIERVLLNQPLNQSLDQNREFSPRSERVELPYGGSLFVILETEMSGENKRLQRVSICGDSEKRMITLRSELDSGTVRVSFSRESPALPETFQNLLTYCM